MIYIENPVFIYIFELPCTHYELTGERGINKHYIIVLLTIFCSILVSYHRYTKKKRYFEVYIIINTLFVFVLFLDDIENMLLTQCVNLSSVSLSVSRANLRVLIDYSV